VLTLSQFPTVTCICNARRTGQVFPIVLPPEQLSPRRRSKPLQKLLKNPVPKSPDNQNCVLVIWPFFPSIHSLRLHFPLVSYTGESKKCFRRGHLPTRAASLFRLITRRLLCTAVCNPLPAHASATPSKARETLSALIKNALWCGLGDVFASRNVERPGCHHVQNT